MKRGRKTATIVNANLQVQEIVRDEARTTRSSKRKKPEASLPALPVGGGPAVQEAAKTVRKQRKTKKQPEDPFQSLRDQELPEELKIKKKTKVIRITPDFVEEKGPAPAHINRPRAKSTKVGAKPKVGHTQSTKPCRTAPEKRCAFYVGQGFKPLEGKLYCSICFTFVAHRQKSHVDQHIITRKHVARLKAQRPEDKKIIDALLQKHRENPESSGKTLDHSTLEIRFRLIRALLIAGIPKSRFFDPHGELRPLMEELAQCQLAEKNSIDLITPVCQQEMDFLKEELKQANKITLIFDGASEVSEVFAVVARYWSGTTYHQRLVKLAWVEALDGQGEANILFEAVASDLGVAPSRVFACVRDGASVNDTCVSFMRTLNSNIVNVTCVSHTSCRCSVFNCVSATSFISTWSTMLAESPKGRAKFSALTGTKSMMKSRVKWFAEYEVISQLHNHWASALQIIDMDDDFAATNREHLRKIVRSGLIEVVRREIALMFDVGKYLVKLCYLSEGDDIISPFVFSDLEAAKKVLDSIKDRNNYEQYLPSVLSLCQDLEKRDPRYDARVLMEQEYVKAIPVAEKFDQLFYGKHKSMLKVWQFCSLFFPPVVLSDTSLLEACLRDVEDSLPPVLQGRRAKLLAELPAYLGAARSFNPQTCTITSFWNKHKKLLPTWSECLEYVALLSPSSAAAERVFAQLRRMFHDDQKNALQDYKSGAMMLRYNKKQRDLERQRDNQLQIELNLEANNREQQSIADTNNREQQSTAEMSNSQI